ncbi:E3 ubiquitin-ligase RING1-like [Chaetoceros tenuissimus]|uniref:E3 ubiquitin-ligase RING1-like n=1 Tax=Chaetoceros tenuissimus TaxID=426638 RepID=A0AAD3CF64_9STRA|nr:E3 ubiquitin-ligase RING1-like [Chaetoceros tenuissimus]
MITYESVSAQQHGPLDTMNSSIPSHDTNETPNLRNQRMRKLRSLFACLFPRAQMENRWKNTCNLDSKYKGMQKNLIIKEIDKSGIIDDYEEPVIAPGTNSCCQKPFLVKNKKRFSIGDTFSTEYDSTTHSSSDTSFEKLTNFHAGERSKFALNKEETSADASPEPYAKRRSRRMIDCSQTCPICWDSFKVGERVCWSKNTSCCHGYHLDCMLVWLKDHDKCPMCREEYIRKQRKHKK